MKDSYTGEPRRRPAGGELGDAALCGSVHTRGRTAASGSELHMLVIIACCLLRCHLACRWEDGGRDGCLVAAAAAPALLLQRLADAEDVTLARRGARPRRLLGRQYDHSAAGDASRLLLVVCVLPAPDKAHAASQVCSLSTTAHAIVQPLQPSSVMCNQRPQGCWM